jgi:uncharacterized protein YbaA (DUF1428 family)
MAHYVNGFVLPISKDKIDLYRSIAEEAGKIWREHGALEYRECIAEDMDAKDMVSSFPQIAGAKPGETVVFAWIVFESRGRRDEVNAKVIADPRLKQMSDKGPVPFDCKRVAYGGFQTIVEA